MAPEICVDVPKSEGANIGLGIQSFAKGNTNKYSEESSTNILVKPPSKVPVPYQCPHNQEIH